MPFHPTQTEPTVAPITVTHSRTVAIVTRYYGPGNVRGSRITAWRSDEKSPRDDAYAVTVPWNYGLDSAENHAAAVQAYVERHVADGHYWDGEWLLSAAHDGYVAVYVPGSGR